MIINSSFLVGESFELLEVGHIVIDDNRIREINEGYEVGGLDCRRYLVMPGLINAHTHLGDSFAKEAVLGMSVGRAVGRRGIKWRLYREADGGDILNAMRDSLRFMLSSGVTGFVDFREGGLEGVNLLRRATAEFPIRSVILGRNMNICECDGFGLNVYQLDQIPPNREGKIIAIHAGEKNKEVEIALENDPDVIIHFVHFTEDDLETACKKGVSIVLCPRSNAALGVGLPRVREILNSGINVALGTDNVMINSPDMFREMEFISKISYLDGGIAPVDVLRMATVNAAKIFGLNSGIIEKGRSADLIFIDLNAPNLNYNKNLIAVIVNRCSPENVRKVMVAGRFVLDKDV